MLAEYREEQWLGERVPPPAELLAQFGPLAVRGHQFVDADGQAHRITSRTVASVEASGSIAVTRGRDLAAKAAGGLLVPGGVFVFGNARHRMHDMRELLLVLEDPGVALRGGLSPRYRAPGTQLAAAVRRAASLMLGYEAKVAALNKRGGNPRAERQSADDGDKGTAHSAADPVTQLSKLADLRDRGALTDAEFEIAKAKILQDW
jgi:hypothetical protein